MIDPKQIPDEVVEAAWKAFDAHNQCRMAEAIAAAIAAWPGASTGPNIYHRRDAILHLPLPQETDDIDVAEYDKTRWD